MYHRNSLVVGMLGCLMALTARPAHAVTYYWSGTDNWNTTNVNWGTASGGPYNVSAWGTIDDDAVFEGTAGSVSLTATNPSAKSLSFTANGYSVSGGTLTFGGTGGVGLINTNANSATVGSIVAGSVGLTKQGSGTLTLTNTGNSYTGGTTVSQGILRSSGAGSTQGTITLNDASTGANNVSWLHTGGGSPSNNFIVANQGSGTVTIGTYGGPFTTLTGTLTLNRATTLTDATGDRTSFTGKISGNVGTLTITGGRVTLDNTTNDFTGNIVVGSGSILQINSGGGVIPDTANVTVDGDLRNGGGTNETIAGLTGSGVVRAANPGGFNFTVGAGNASSTFAGTFLTGASGGKLIKTGNGTLTLTNTGSTFNQVTDINAGTLQLGDGTSNGLPGTNSININAVGANLTVNNGSDQIISQAIIGTGSLTKTGSNVLTLTSNSNNYSGATTISGGTLQIGNNGTTGVLASGSAISNSGTLSYFRSDDISVSNVITGAGTILKRGAGALSLSNANTSFTGNTTISTGTINWNNNDALGTAGTVTLNDTNTGSSNTTLNRNAAGTLARNIVVANQGTGTATIGNDTGATTVNYTGTVTLNKSVALRAGAAAGVANFTNTISGGGGITKTGLGTITLSGNNAFGGGTTISQGNLILSTSVNAAGISGAIALGDANTSTNAVTLTANVGSGNFSNPITVTTNGTGTATLAGNANYLTYSGLITLNRATTLGGTAGDRYGYSGKITGNVGTLTIDAPRITFDQSGANANDFTGNVVINAGRTLQLNTINGLNANHAVAANGLLRLVSGPASTATIGTLTGNGTVHGDTGGGNYLKTLSLGGDNGTGTFSGSISNGSGGDTVALIKAGSGTQTLSGTLSYSGTTTINAGTLLVNGTHTGGGTYTVGDGTGVDTLGGTGSLSAAVALMSGGKLSPGASVESLATGANTWNGGGLFDFEFTTDGTGTAGTQWDLLAITGGLNLTSVTSGNPIGFNLFTMSNSNTTGLLGTWDPNVNHTWAGFLTTSTGVTAFASNKFSINTSGFQNPISGTFSVVQNGNNLDLVYIAVPEPGSIMMLLFGSVMLWFFGRKRSV